MTKTLTRLLTLVLLFTSCAFAQSTVTFTAANISNSKGDKLASGSLCFLPTDNADFVLPGYKLQSGQSVKTQVCTPITNGAASTTIANTATTTPLNVCFRVTVLPSGSQTPILTYKCVQPVVNSTDAAHWCTSGTCNFDAYTPNLAPQIANVGVKGDKGDPGVGYMQGVSSDGDSGIVVQKKVKAQSVEADNVAVGTTVQMGWFPRFFSGSLASKKIVVWGNSTVSAATEFFTELQKFGSTGDVLEGFNFSNLLNYGNNGAPLGSTSSGAGLQTVGNPGGWTYPITSVISATPDLLIIRGPLINDVRLGTCDLTCATSRLTTALDTLTTALPNTDILLTTENSFTCVDSSHSNYISPNTAVAAQSYTDIVRQAVLSKRGIYPHVFVFDVQSAMYGRQCSNMSDLMLNQLHPNTKAQRQEADLIASLLSAAKFGVLPTAPSNGATPNTLYVGSDVANPNVAGGEPYIGIIANGAAGTYRYHQFRTAGVVRWLCGADNTAESGANAGTNYACQAYGDDGTALGAYLTIDRASGKVTVLRDFTSMGNGVFNGTLQSNGNATFAGVTTSGANIGGQLVQQQDAFRANTSGATIASDKALRFSSTTASSGTADTALIRTGAGSVKVTNASTGTGTLVHKLPTSCSGMESGTLYNNGGTPAICP